MRTFAIAAALAAAVIPGLAQAQTVHITDYAWNPGLVNGDVHYINGFALGGVGIGQFEMKGNIVPSGDPVDIFSYCIDIFTRVGPGDFVFSSIGSVMTDLNRQNQLQALLAHTNPLLAAATGDNAIQISAATQMAVWEIAYEDSANPLLAGSGDFFLNNGDASFDSARTLADSYLAKIADSGVNGWHYMPGLQLAVLESIDGGQSQVYLVAAPVPEPASWGMMILGFGVMGGAMRRRMATRRAVAIA